MSTEFNCKRKGHTDHAKCYACYQKMKHSKRPASRAVCKNENKVTTPVKEESVPASLTVATSVLDL